MSRFAIMLNAPSTTLRPIRALGALSSPARAKACFWASLLVLDAASALVLVVLGRVLPPGELAGMVTVFSISLVLTPLPLALQSGFATHRAATGRRGAMAPGPLLGVAAVGLVVAPVVSEITHVPVAAVLAAVAQVIPGVVVAAHRGDLIGSRRFYHAASSHLIEAAVRVVAGLLLGLRFGAVGIALSILLAFAVTATRARPLRGWVRRVDAVKLPSRVAAMGLLLFSVNVDVFVAGRMMNPSEVDGFILAALPGKLLFFGFMAAGWLAIPRASRELEGSGDRRPSVTPIITTVAAALAVGALLVATSTWSLQLLGRGAPSHAHVALLVAAMACASGVWIGLQTVTVGHRSMVWVPSALTVSIVVAAAVAGWSLFGAVLVGHAVALAVTIGLVRWGPVLSPSIVRDLPATSGLSARAAATVRTFRGRVGDPEHRAPAEPEPEPEPGQTRGLTPVRTAALLVVSSAIIALCVMQSPGRIIDETKLDLALDPLRFLARNWSLWDPTADMGRVQNQAVGYLFPMGPFYVLGHLATLPVWLIQRLWMGLVLVAAFWGTVRLMDAWRIGIPSTRVLGALSYAFGAFFVARIGSTSAMATGGALLPWMLLPLVSGARRGSPRRAAFRSGLAVLAAGGINGAVVLGVLPMVGLWLLTRSSGSAPTPADRLVGGCRGLRDLLVASAAAVPEPLWLRLPPVLGTGRADHGDDVDRRGAAGHP